MAFFMLSICSTPQKKLNLASEQNGQEFEISIQADIKISLKSNPTTGYTWTIQSNDSAIIRQVGKPSFKAESKKLGSSGIQTFNFKSIASGKTKLKLIYHRPWEKETAPLDSYLVVFNIKE